jgi:hypothetical protein
VKRTPLARKQSLGWKKPVKKPASLKAEFSEPKAKKRPKQKCPSVAVLDNLFSLYIRRFGECQFWKVGGIQCSTQLQCSHIHSRRFHSVRWDERNAICVCAAHHHWQHAHPTLNTWALEELLGKAHLEELRDAYLNGKKPTPDQKRAIAEYLREKLKEAA